ncbi:hypothetical protein LX36DRAFT_181391 [Colletotrichum falcatum]|nr:hypothetical protein LX36DRAFT_181391 [Colletotrichum falcatum]
MRQRIPSGFSGQSAQSSLLFEPAVTGALSCHCQVFVIAKSKSLAHGGVANGGELECASSDCRNDHISPWAHRARVNYSMWKHVQKELFDACKIDD